MPDRHKILLLDDDADLLEMYREMLGKLPSHPEIHTATSGARAIALLEAQRFTLLVSDLNMPKMDGLQVLTIVRRKFPQLRTAVMTSVVDPQFRARAYQMGIDLFLEKPNTQQEVDLFVACIESLLDRNADGGFRGVQSKSLIDIIQLECLSHSSSLLKVTNGALTGRIWFDAGDVIDAEAQGLVSEEAFRAILAWKTGAFEILPPESGRPRAIHTSYQGLLLDSAQALDEAQAAGAAIIPAEAKDDATAAGSPLAALGQVGGVEFALKLSAGSPELESWGLKDPERLAGWLREATHALRALGDELRAGDLQRLDCVGPQNHLSLAIRGPARLCVGFSRSLSQGLVRENMEKIVAKWVS